VRATEPQPEDSLAEAPGSDAVQAQAGYENGAAPAIIASFSDYGSLLAALRACREARNIAYETLDEIVGAPKGYFSKVFAPRSERKITMQSLGWAMAGLGVKAILVDDPLTLKLVANRMKSRDEKVVRSGATHIVLSHRFLREIGAKGGRRKNALSRFYKERARKGAAARWHGRNGAGR
jgi:hypothetical protein